MRKLYKEYFYIPEDGKIREKVFVTRVTVAVLGILMWMSAMGFTAYAYYSSSITSGANIIEAAVYSTEINVKDTSIEDEVSATLQSDASLTNSVASNYTLSAGKTYKVEIKATGTASTGYCEIEVGQKGQDGIYYTIPIKKGETLTFTIECYKSSTVGIITNWGSCSVTDQTKIIAGNGSIRIGEPITRNSETPVGAAPTETSSAKEMQTSGNTEPVTLDDSPETSTGTLTGTSTGTQETPVESGEDDASDDESDTTVSEESGTIR